MPAKIRFPEGTDSPCKPNKRTSIILYIYIIWRPSFISIQTSVVLGRDALNILDFDLAQKSVETNDASLILNIDVSSKTDNATDSP